MIPEIPENTRLPIPFAANNGSWKKWVLAIACALAASMLMPVADTFLWQYKVGAPWMYADLIAPMPLSIAPGEDVVSVDKPQTAWFAIDPAIAKQQKQYYVNLVDEQVRISKNDAQYDDLRENAAAYKAYGQGLLEHLYTKGIVSDLPENMAWSVISSRPGIQIPSNRLTRLNDALAEVADSLPFSPLREPELIFPMLEQSITANAFYSEEMTIANSKGSRDSSGAIIIAAGKGDTLLRKGMLVTARQGALLEALRQAQSAPRSLPLSIGYALFSLIAFMSLTAWVFFFKPKVVEHPQLFPLMLVLVLGAQLLIYACFRLGEAIPLILPLYLIPLLLRKNYGFRTALIIWSVPVLLTGFSLEWGMLWTAVQIAGTGIALLLNSWVSGWGQRLGVLAGIFIVQSLVVTSFWLAGKAPVSLCTTDCFVFLAIAAMLSVSRSVLSRFFPELPI